MLPLHSALSLLLVLVPFARAQAADATPSPATQPFIDKPLLAH